MKPSIGRIVHYVDRHGIHNPAIITRVDEHVAGRVELTVFSVALSDPVAYRAVCDDDQENVPYVNSWHWLEREA